MEELKFYPADIQLAVLQAVDKHDSQADLGRQELKPIADRFNGGVYGHIETEYRKLFDDGFIEGDIVSGADRGNLCLKNVKLSVTGLDLLGWLAEDIG